MSSRSQFRRYVMVGAFNTGFGYLSYVLVLRLLTAVLPARLLALTVVLASVVTTPLNITAAYLGYKFFVFRTHGGFLREWLKCFAVYATAMVPGLLLLSILTRLLQSIFHRHALDSPALAGYVAGALTIALTTVYSFFGHRHVTFRRPHEPRQELPW